MTIPKNALPTEEQFRMRELVSQLAREEVPLSPEDLVQLAPFVERVRHEIREQTAEPAVLNDEGLEIKPRVPARAWRVDYYKLNERGLKLKFQWERGLLDRRLD